MSQDAIGVLVMAYGGPDSLDDVEPYLLDVRGGRSTPEHIVAEVRERYRAIGGRSPIKERTTAQARRLQAALDASAHGGPFTCVVGMKHWTPRIGDALDRLAADGITRAVGVVMAPHYSRLSVGGYFTRIDQAATAIDVERIERWHLLPEYLDAVAARVTAALGGFPPEARADTPVVFSAHSLPRRILEWNDPYCDELHATVREVAARLGNQPHEFAFQSAAMTPEPWLGPDVGDVITRLHREGRPGAVIAPIGFTSDHVEIAYDIDIEYAALARTLSFPVVRMEMLNDDAGTMAGLADLVRRAAAGRGWCP